MHPGELLLLNSTLGVVGTVVNSHAHYLEAFIAIFGIDFLESTSFAAARTAPTCPEIENHHFALAHIIRQASGDSGTFLYFEIDKLASHGSNRLCSRTIVDCLYLGQRGIRLRHLGKKSLHLCEVVVAHQIVDKRPSAYAIIEVILIQLGNASAHIHAERIAQALRLLSIYLIVAQTNSYFKSHIVRLRIVLKKLIESAIEFGALRSAAARLRLVENERYFALLHHQIASCTRSRQVGNARALDFAFHHYLTALHYGARHHGVGVEVDKFHLLAIEFIARIGGGDFVVPSRHKRSACSHQHQRSKYSHHKKQLLFERDFRI